MPHAAPQDTARAPRHARLFELLRQQSLANERFFPPSTQETDAIAPSVAEFQDLARSSLYAGRPAG